MGVIYCYHCIPTGRKYIGQTINERLRKNTHKYIGTNLDLDIHQKYQHLPFYRAIAKYGYDQFIYGVIEECKNDQLNDREEYYIDHYNTYIKGLNARPGGMHKPHPPEVLKKIGDAQRRRVWTEEQREMMRQYARERGNSYMTQEIRDKISNAVKGNGAKCYEITYTDGRVIRIKNLQQWCKDNGYNLGTIRNRLNARSLYKGSKKKHVHPEIKTVVRIQEAD